MKSQFGPAWRLMRPVLIAAALAALVAGVVAAIQTAGEASPAQERSRSIVGTWEGRVRGAQYEPHLYQFHDDGTMEGTNPQRVQERPDGTGVNDSLAMGDWWVERGQVVGVFKELNAHQGTPNEAPTLTVKFRLTVRGDHLTGTAKVFVGTEQVPDATFELTRLS